MQALLGRASSWVTAAGFGRRHQLALHITLQAQPGQSQSQGQQADANAKQWSAIFGLLVKCFLTGRVGHPPRAFRREADESQLWFWATLELTDSESAKEVAGKIGRTVASSPGVACINMVVDQQHYLSYPWTGGCRRWVCSSFAGVALTSSPAGRQEPALTGCACRRCSRHQ